jgi:hypothetical protein
VPAKRQAEKCIGFRFMRLWVKKVIRLEKNAAYVEVASLPD